MIVNPYHPTVIYPPPENLCHPTVIYPPPETLREIPKWDKEWEELSDEEIPDLFPEEIPWRSFVWDPDNRATWEHYANHPDYYRLLPGAPSFESGEEILCLPVFELYSIEIKKLDPHQKNFDMILFKNETTGYVPVVIYKRGGGGGSGGDGDGGEIATNQPLPLKGPERPPNAEYPVLIALTNPINGGWSFYFDPKRHDKYDEPLRSEFMDKDAYSKAVVKYEVIKEAVKASLEFQFIPLPPQQGKRKQREEEEEEEECPPIQILEGTIFATNDGEPKTKRIVKQFSSSSHQMTNSVLPVDRYVFGVPKGSNIQVTAENLICSTTTATFGISGTLCFHAPTHSASEVHFFASTDGCPTRLRLTVFWSDAVV